MDYHITEHDTDDYPIWTASVATSFMFLPPVSDGVSLSNGKLKRWYKAGVGAGMQFAMEPKLAESISLRMAAASYYYYRKSGSEHSNGATSKLTHAYQLWDYSFTVGWRSYINDRLMLTFGPGAAYGRSKLVHVHEEHWTSNYSWQKDERGKEISGDRRGYYIRIFLATGLDYHLPDFSLFCNLNNHITPLETNLNKWWVSIDLGIRVHAF